MKEKRCMRLWTSLVCLFFFISMQAQVKVTGTVLDTQRDPLTGASVIVKGTTEGTITDIDGKFVISVPNKNSTLEISFIGYQKQSIPLKGKDRITVVMEEDAQAIDEVVVVGYGTQKRQSVTGSVAQISNKEIMQAPVGNISTMLAGRISGITAVQTSGQPGSDDAALLIRGISTTGNTSPIILVDGVQRSFNQLDPNEIESITTLKDASAAAVYGMQAANGVILVTTKRGKQENATVTYSASGSMNTNTRFPQFMDGPQYAYWYNKALEMDGLDPRFSESDVNKMINGDPEGKLGNTNWVDKIFRTGWTQHHNLSVSGGGKNSRYFVSAGYYDQKGNVKRFDFQRFNLRSNVDATIAEHLELSVDLAGRLENRDAPTLGVGKNEYMSIPMQAIRMHPYLPQTYEGVPVGSLVNPIGVNPLAARDLSGSNQTKMAVFQSNITAKWNLPWVKGLNVKAMISYDHDYTYGKAYKTPYDLMNANVSNMATHGVIYTKVPFQAITETSLTESMGRASRFTGQYSINYANNFGKHDVTGLLLYEHSERKYNSFFVNGREFDLEGIPELDHANSIGKGDAFGGKSYTQPRAGYVGRFTYAYDSKYLVELSGRYDGSYKFAPNKRWEFFPAVSVGWRISSEDFFRSAVDFVDNLKVRLSYGRLGSDANVNAFNYLRYMDWANDNPLVVIGGIPQRALMTSSIASPNMGWEVATNYNAGVEASLWNGKLSVEFDWFYKVTSDILRSQSGLMPPSIGGNYESKINSGKVDSRGFDLVLSHNNRIGQVSYGARFNLNWAHSKIIKIDNSPNITNWMKQNGNTVGMKDGFIADGLFQSYEEIANSAVVNDATRPGDIKYRDLNGDGKITYDQDRTWIGKSAIPELMGGLNLTADWNGFDVSILFQGAAISDVALMGFYENVGWDNTQFTRPFYGGGNSPVDLIENSWRPDNTNAKYPRLTTKSGNNNAFSNTIWMIDGSYLRLKNAQIGYSLPRKIVRYIGAEKLRFYLAGSNLATWSHNPFLDPEAPDVNNGYYPQQRTYTFGLNLTF